MKWDHCCFDFQIDNTRVNHVTACSHNCCIFSEFQCSKVQTVVLSVPVVGFVVLETPVSTVDTSIFSFLLILAQG